MDLILCHTTADFDTLGAAVGMTYLRPGARIVLSGGEHPNVRAFLALHRNAYPLIERKAVNPDEIRSITVVDASERSRLGKTAEWLGLPQLQAIYVYDHHLNSNRDIATAQESETSPPIPTYLTLDSVGAATTLVVEQLMQQPLKATPIDAFAATVMALGIHMDTGSLSYANSTPRDARALAWLMEQGANVDSLREYMEPGLSSEIQELLGKALETLHTDSHQGYRIGSVLLTTPDYVGGLAKLTSELLEITGHDAVLLGVAYGSKGNPDEPRLNVIGRSKIGGTSLSEIFKHWGGGGHAKAASLALRNVNAADVLAQLKQQFIAQIPAPLTAQDLMSSPVRTIAPDVTIEAAQGLLLRYGHSGLCIVNGAEQLIGIISRRDVDLALHHGFRHAPVKGYMSRNLKTIAPEATLPEIEHLMVTYDVGRLPVIKPVLQPNTAFSPADADSETVNLSESSIAQKPVPGELIGIVTRTDVLRVRYRKASSQQNIAPQAPTGQASTPQTSSTQTSNTQMAAHQTSESPLQHLAAPSSSTDALLPVREILRNRLLPQLWTLLETAAQHAESQGWHLYLVGGGVRDLLLADPSEPLLLNDVDLVVDGFHRSIGEAAGVELAEALQNQYPEARLDIHGKFQTAALLWHQDPVFQSMWVDIATARTEFYPYPAANPVVEASSIQQDLYRRDFTINALAVQLTEPRAGEMLDFFGGVLDLGSRQIRVLHANSFIEDPTRIYRAVRFAVRLGFEIESQTREYIIYALNSGVYERTQGENSITPALQTRLRSELEYILEAGYWKSALKLLGELTALRCLHPTLQLTPTLWAQVRRIDRMLRPLSATLPSLPAPWLLRLEVLIAALSPGVRPGVATKLQLPADSIQRLSELEPCQEKIIQTLAQQQRPSQIYQRLRSQTPALLILVAARVDRSTRRQIWRYLTDWIQAKPPLNGTDLQALGYKPGKQFKPMLSRVLAAYLDGELGASAIPLSEQKQAARLLIAAEFPPPERDE